MRQDLTRATEALRSAELERDQLKASLQAAQESLLSIQTAFATKKERIAVVERENEQHVSQLKTLATELEAHKDAMLKQAQELTVCPLITRLLFWLSLRLLSFASIKLNDVLILIAGAEC
jgi:uncharacterized membrane protein (DUF106 family)